MTENNAAEPGLTDDQIDALRVRNDAVKDPLAEWERGSKRYRRAFARLVESALLSKLRAEGVQAGDERDKLEADAFASTNGETAQLRHWWRKGYDTALQTRAAESDISNIAGQLWDDAIACDWPAFRARVVAALAGAPVVGESVCKGSMALGSGCGACERCKAEVQTGSAPVAGEASEAKYKRMFMAACEALAAINEKLGLDPNDGEPDAILTAIGDLMGRAEGAAPQASEAVRAHNDAIKAAAKVCTDIARQYDPQNNQEHALASELYSAALAIRKLEKDGGDCAKGAGVEQRPILAADHVGMHVDYTGLFGQARSALKRGEPAPALAEMLRQFAVHLTELGQRWYSGDATVVDELLQLYCIESDARAALSAQKLGDGDAG